MLQKQTRSTMQWACTRGIDLLRIDAWMDGVLEYWSKWRSYDTEQGVLSRFDLLKKIGSPVISMMSTV